MPGDFTYLEDLKNTIKIINKDGQITPEQFTKLLESVSNKDGLSGKMDKAATICDVNGENCHRNQDPNYWAQKTAIDELKEKVNLLNNVAAGQKINANDLINEKETELTAQMSKDKNFYMKKNNITPLAENPVANEMEIKAKDNKVDLLAYVLKETNGMEAKEMGKKTKEILKDVKGSDPALQAQVDFLTPLADQLEKQKSAAVEKGGKALDAIGKKFGVSSPFGKKNKSKSDDEGDDASKITGRDAAWKIATKAYVLDTDASENHEIPIPNKDILQKNLDIVNGVSDTGGKIANTAGDVATRAWILGGGTGSMKGMIAAGKAENLMNKGSNLVSAVEVGKDLITSTKSNAGEGVKAAGSVDEINKAHSSSGANIDVTKHIDVTAFADVQAGADYKIGVATANAGTSVNRRA